MNRLLLTTLMGALVIMAGCGETTDTAQAPAKPKDQSDGLSGGKETSETPEWANSESEEQKAAVESSRATTVELPAIDLAGYQQAIEDQAGKVVLVDFWATWCIPCRKSFPHTVELAERYHDKGLVVITIACDDEIAEHQIKEFLLKQNAAGLVNYRSIYGSEAESFESFEIGDTGLPHYKLYGKSGELLKTYFSDAEDTPIDQAELEETIKQSL